MTTTPKFDNATMKKKMQKKIIFFVTYIYIGVL